MNNKLQVMKFGGTSVGDAECIRRAAEIVFDAAKNNSVVVVVSAMSGVTNRLIAAAQKASSGNRDQIEDLPTALRDQHFTAATSLVKDGALQAQLKAELETITSEVANLCQGISLLRELTPRAHATVSSIGERLSARLMAATLREMGLDSVAVEATEVIVTDEQYLQAEPLMKFVRERCDERLRPLLSDGITPVVTGFIGATTEGTLTTLGRGGSDYSATTLGGALDADEIIIWTDVDGVLTADPPGSIRPLASRDLVQRSRRVGLLWRKGSASKTLRPVVDAQIPVWIRNSFAPAKAGTRITAGGHPTEHGARAITAIPTVSMITIGGRGIVGVVGVAAKTFQAVASVRANVLLISQSSSENDICLIVESSDAPATLKALRSAFATDLVHHDVEHITVNSDIAIVAVVGEKMRGTPGIAGRTFSALGRGNINIIAIAQGSSEYNVSFVVEAGAMKEAMRTVHDEFNLGDQVVSECDEVSTTTR